MANKNIIDTLNSRKIEYFFPPIKNYNNLKINIEGSYSITAYKYADMMSKIIYDLFKTKQLTVIDATANVGGNTISFSKVFSKVLAIEKNKETFEMLKNNIGIYNLDNVALYCGDCLDIVPKLAESHKIDVIFMDPPWGGKEYITMQWISLFLSKVNITNIIETFEKYAKYIAIKVPFNFNFIQFFKQLSYSGFEIHKIHYKYYMIVIDME